MSLLDLDPIAEAAAKVLHDHGADGRAAHCMPDLGWSFIATLIGVPLLEIDRGKAVGLLHDLNAQARKTARAEARDAASDLNGLRVDEVGADTLDAYENGLIQ